LASGECTQPVANVVLQQPGCPQDVPQYLVASEYPTLCQTSVRTWPRHVYPIGAFVGGSGAYVKNGATCGGWGAQTSSLYAVGAEIAPTEFVAATEGVDP
jgi:hypothetical protein